MKKNGAQNTGRHEIHGLGTAKRIQKERGGAFQEGSTIVKVVMYDVTCSPKV